MSSYFVWTPELESGVQIIDAEHKVLIRLADNLHTAMATGNGDRAIDECLEGLLGYTLVHFTVEEKLMRSYSYTDATAHAAEHTYLKNYVRQLIANYNDGALTVTIDTSDFLKEWLINHIMTSDFRLAKFLNSKGVK